MPPSRAGCPVRRRSPSTPGAVRGTASRSWGRPFPGAEPSASTMTPRPRRTRRGRTRGRTRHTCAAPWPACPCRMRAPTWWSRSGARAHLDPRRVRPRAGPGLPARGDGGPHHAEPADLLPALGRREQPTNAYHCEYDVAELVGELVTGPGIGRPGAREVHRPPAAGLGEENGALVGAQRARAPESWDPTLAGMVRQVRAGDFEIRADDLDASLDLVVVARRVG